MKAAYDRGVGVAVAMLTASLMATELILTRIFSVVVWYHFAFFAISVALFGTGAAALLVHMRLGRLAPERVRSQLAKACIALTVVVVVVDLLLVNVTPDWFAPGSAFTHVTLKLVALFGLAAAPFAVGGFAIALAMTRFAASAHVLYFWDLVGAGVGCLLVIPLLGIVGGPLALVFAALIAAGAAALFAQTAGSAAAPLRLASRLALGATAVVLMLAPGGGWLDVRFARGVKVADFAPELIRWNSFSMVTVSPVSVFRGWGISPKYQGAFPEQKSLIIDMNALTSLTRFSGNFDDVRYVQYDLSAVVYRLRPAPDRVCVIGAGGGKDVLAALSFGAKEVTAVEINPLIVQDVMKHEYREFTGGLYLRDDVRPVIADGRTHARTTEERYDVVLLSMVDTSAATAAGAYALTENSLYTREAFEDFFSVLGDGGVLSVSSVSIDGLATGARLAAIARAALERRGADPSKSVFVASTPWLHLPSAVLYDVIVKPDGFTPGEIERLDAATSELGFRVVFPQSNDDLAEERWIRAILTSPKADLDATLASWPRDVSATTDDRPFFFYQNRLSDLGQGLSTQGLVLFGNGLAILARVAVVAVALVAAFLLFPFLVRRAEIKAGHGRSSVDVSYVACLGLGFMFVEIAMIQRFSLYLGNPMYSLAVVLFVILVGGGVGSRWLASAPLGRLRARLTKSIAVLVVYALVAAASLDSLFHAAAGWSEAARALLSAALLAPAGVLLGAPLPAGIKSIGARAESRIPWLWAVNSATSVLGSILATICSLHFGISRTLVVGALLYALALALGRVVLRAAGSFAGGGRSEGAPVGATTAG